MVSKKRGAGEGTIYERADGRWEAKIDITGPTGKRRRKSVYGKTRAEVVTKLRKAKTAADTGMLAPDERRTTADYLRWWLTDVLPTTGVAPRTVEGYGAKIELYIIPAVGRVPLARLGPHHVQTMMNALAKRGLSGRTQQYARATLRRALADAERWGMVPRNVATLVRPPKTAKAKTDDWPSADEMRSLIAAAKGDRLEPLIVLVCATGLRKGEATGLRWSAVDLDARTVRVEETLSRLKGRGLVVSSPKTDRSRRTIPLPGFVVEVLREQRQRQREERLRAGPMWQQTGYVFTTAVGTPIDPSNLTGKFHTVCDRAGIGHRRFHALRHGAATLMLAEGVPLEVISATLGHGGLQITADVYAHVQPAAQRQAGDAMDRALGSR